MIDGVRQGCCRLWTEAHIEGTDNEGWQALIDYYENSDRARLPRIGRRLVQAIGRPSHFVARFCPFCGASKGERTRLGRAPKPRRPRATGQRQLLPETR